MSEVEISDAHKKLIQSIAEKEGIVDYEITLRSGSDRGDNYLGVITTVLLKDRASSKELNFVLKSSIQNEEARKQAPIRLAYVREIFVYEKIFKAYEDLQKENNVKNPFKAYAKFYGSCLEDLEECLILENMKAIGYKMWSRKEPMNADHIAKVFTEYGKLHGVSTALKYKKPELFNELKKDKKNVFIESMPDEMLQNYMLTKYNKLAEDLQDDPKIFAILRKYIDEKATEFCSHSQDIGEFAVLTHGDCWNNNMLFKYGDKSNPTKPTEVCLLDWQISHYGSPMEDISYFFFACSPKEVLYEHISYLKIYYKSFSNILSELGCDPEKIMTYDQCEEQWKKYCEFGLYVSMVILKIMLSESEEVVTLAELADSGKNLFDAFGEASVNDHIYKRRMTDIITFLHDNDLVFS